MSRLAPFTGGLFSVGAMLMCLGLAFAQPTALAAQAQAEVPPGWHIAGQHLQAGNPAAALPYLEKLVRDHPDIVLYRLELGYALFLLERDTRAKYHFQQARGADLSVPQRNAVNGALAKIEARKIWSVRLGFGLEPASNAGKGTAAGSVNLGGIVFPVPSHLQSKPATGAVMTAGATYRPRINENLEATFSLDSLIKYYSEDYLRETIVVGRGGLRWSPKQNVFVEGGVLYGKSYAGDQHYSDRYGIFGSYTTPIGQSASARFGIEHYQMDHESFALADGRRTQVDAQFVYAISPNALLRTRGYALHTDATGALQSGWQGAVTIGGTYAFKGGLTATFDVTTGMDRRDGVNNLTGKRREDRSLAFEAGLFSSKFQIGPFIPVLRVKYQRNRSNEVLNSYSNRSINIGFISSF